MFRHWSAVCQEVKAWGLRRNFARSSTGLALALSIMVKDLFDHAGSGQGADIFNFATDADNTQRAEIRIMQNMLKENR